MEEPPVLDEQMAALRLAFPPPSENGITDSTDGSFWKLVRSAASVSTSDYALAVIEGGVVGELLHLISGSLQESGASSSPKVVAMLSKIEKHTAWANVSYSNKLHKLRYPLFSQFLFLRLCGLKMSDINEVADWHTPRTPKEKKDWIGRQRTRDTRALYDGSKPSPSTRTLFKVFAGKSTLSWPDFFANTLMAQLNKTPSFAPASRTTGLQPMPGLSALSVTGALPEFRRSDLSLIFPLHYSGNNPTLEAGLFRQGWTAEALMELYTGVEGKVNLGRAWSECYFKSLSPVESNKQICYSVKLRNGTASTECEMPRAYVTGTGSLLFAFLIFKGLVKVDVCPNEMGGREVESIIDNFNAAMVRLSTSSEALNRRMMQQLADVTCVKKVKLADGGAHLAPTSIAECNKRSSAMMKMFRFSWGVTKAVLDKLDMDAVGRPGESCARGWDRDDPELVRVFSGDMHNAEPMITWFALVKFATRVRGVNQVNYFMHIPDVKNGIVVNSVVITPNIVADVCRAMVSGMRAKLLSLFGEVHDSVKDVVGGRVPVSVYDYDSEEQFSFSYNIEVPNVDDPEKGSQLRVVRSAWIGDRVKRELWGMDSRRKAEWKKNFLGLGHTIQAFLGLLCPNRAEEVRRSVRRDDGSGCKRGLRFYNVIRSRCNSVPLCVLFRNKRKGSQCAIHERLVARMPADATIALMFFSGLREDVAAGLATSTHPSAGSSNGGIHVDFLSLLFPDGGGEMQGEGFASTNFNRQVKTYVDVVNVDRAKKREKFPYVLHKEECEAVDTFCQSQHRVFLQAIQNEVSNEMKGAVTEAGTSNAKLVGHTEATKNKMQVTERLIVLFFIFFFICFNARELLICVQVLTRDKFTTYANARRNAGT